MAAKYLLPIIIPLIIILSPYLLNPTRLTLRNGDFRDLTRPNLIFAKQSILKYHQIPLWNPKQFSGIPEIASPISPIIYPPYLLLLFLPIDFGLIILIALHFLGAGYFLYLTGKNVFRWSDSSLLVFIFVFIFSPFIWGKVAVGHIGHAFAILMVAPILYYGISFFKNFKRKDLFLLSICLSLQYLNYPTIWFYSIFLGGLFVFYYAIQKRELSKLLILLAPIVSLILIAPIFLAQYSAGSLVTRSELTLKDLALPIWSIKRFILAVVRPSNFSTDLDTETWLYLSMPAILLASLGFKKLKGSLTRPILLISILTILITLGTRTPLFGLFVKFIPGFSFLRISSRVWFVLIPLISTLAAYYTNSVPKKSKFRKLILVLVLIDTFLFSSLRVWYVPEKMDWKYGPNLTSLIKDQNDLYRYYCTSRCLSWNVTETQDVNSADGYHPIILKSYQKTLSQAGNFNVSGFTGVLPGYEAIGSQPSAERLGELSVKWVVSPYNLTDPSFKQIGQSDNFLLYENSKAEPRARFIDGVGLVNLISDTPNLIKILTSRETEGILILADSYYPGWEAFVDGKRENIFLEGGWARSINLLPGPHLVEFVFRPFDGLIKI